MKIKFFFGAALLLVPLLATPVMALAQTSSALAQARTNETLAPSRTYEMEGREVAAPPWSAACMSDQGPRQCDEPMWVYGDPATISRYRSAF
jgi:hypothetical protein